MVPLVRGDSVARSVRDDDHDADADGVVNVNLMRLLHSMMIESMRMMIGLVMYQAVAQVQVIACYCYY